jgi:hypothetical protein
MTKDEALRLALETMEAAIKSGDWVVDGACDPDMAIHAIKEELAQPEHEWVCGECVKCGSSIERQKPIAWVSEIAEEAELMLEKPRFCAIALYTSPPKREPLTDEEIEDLYFDKFSMGELKEFARAIEAAHGIKGEA